MVTRALAAAGLVGVVLGSLVSLIPAGTADAGTGIYKAVNFQGKLVNTDGTNITNGTYNIEFKMYTGGDGCVPGGSSSSPCAGTLVWTEDHIYGSGSPDNRVTVTDGLFQLDLGTITPLPSVFNTDTVWLSINLGNTSTAATFSSASGDGEMLPFIRFTAAPYAINSDMLQGLHASDFAQLSPSSAQSGFLNVTGNVTSGATVAATTSIQAPLLDTASAVTLNIGTATASAVTIGRTSTPFLVQGNSSSTFTATSSGNTTTVGFTTPTVNTTLDFPASGTAGTYTICTSDPASCSGTYATGSTSGSYLAKNGIDTSSFAVTASNYLYGFTNSSSAVASGVLKLDNGSNTGDALLVTASGNPGSGKALIVANNTAGAPSGNLLDLQKNSTSELSVDYNGNLTQNGGTSTTDTINGQTISSAANFTGTVTAATSVLTPLLDTASAGVLAVGTTNATSIGLNQNTNLASGKNLTFTAGSGNFDQHNSTGTFQTGTGNVSLNGNTTVASGDNLTLTSGQYSQTYSTAVAGNGQTLSFSNTNTGAGVVVQGINLTPTNTAAPSSGTNAMNVENFAAGGALGANDATNGINFASATGYTNFISTPTFVLSSAGAVTGATGVTLASGNFLQNGTGTFTTGSGAVQLDGSTTIASGANLTLTSGSLTQTYSSAAASNAQTLSVTNSNSGASSIAVNGESISLTGTATSGGTNTNTGLLFANPAAAANNIFNGLTFAGTGYNNVLVVNGSSIINGSGVLQSAGLSGTYSNALTLSNASNVFTGSTFNNLTLTSAADGFTIAGGTTPRTLTVTGASITIGSTIQPTASGALTVQSNGGNNLSIDTGGGAAINVGGANATSLVFGNTTSNPTVAFNGSGTFGTTTGNVSLNGNTTVAGTKTFTVNGGLTQLQAGLTVTNGGNVAFQKTTDNSTTGNLNNLAITGALIRFTGASTQTLTGITGGADGRIITLVNAASQALVVKNNDTTDSSAANVIITGTGGDISVPAGASIMVVYDSGTSVWRVSSGTVAATGGYIQNQNAAVQTANYRISGIGEADTSLLTPTLDTATGVTLNIGNTTATAIGVGRSGITTTVTGGLTQQTGVVSLTGNAASSFTTSTGALTLTSNQAATWSTANGNLTLQAGSGTVSLGTSSTLTNGGALTVTGGSTLTLGSTGANAVSIDTGGGAAINVGGANATSLVFGNTTSNPTVAFNGSGTFGTTTGAVSLNGNTTVAGGKNLILASGTGTYTQTSTSNTNIAQTVTGGTTLTTGGDTTNTGTYVHTGTETGSLDNITVNDSSTGTSGTSVSNGLNVGSTINTSGAGAKQVNQINLQAPSITACTSGVCTLDGTRINTITSGAASTITSNAVDIQATGISAGTLNGINISGITAGAGTETAINLGAGWDNLIQGTTTAGNLLSFTNFSVASNGNITGGTYNTDTIGASAFTFSGNAPAISGPGTATSLSIDSGNATADINIGGGTSQNVNLAGGSAATGCTVTNSNGNLACAGNITGAATGTIGYWSRGGTTLQPATAGDAITTTGNISTTSTGTITSAGLLTASGGLTVAANQNVTMSSGTGTFSQTYTGTSDAHAITANSLTTGTALKVTSSNNTAANTSWSADQLNVTNAQGTTAVSGSNLIAGLDVEFTQAATVVGNNETAANFAIAANSGSPTDNTVNSIVNLANNDTATGNQITATNGLLINGSNVTNGINLSGTFGTSLITSSNFSVSQAGAVVGVGVNSGTGLLQGTGGETITGTTQINATTAGTTTIGSSTAGAVAISSGGASSFNVTSANLTLSTTTSGTLAVTSAGALNLTGAAASTWSTGANSLTVTSSNFNVSSTGATTLGATAGSGALVNNGSSKNATDALGDLAAGSIGTAAATVDVYTSFSISPTASGRTYTIPNPTAGTGSVIYISDINATNSFIIGSTTFNPHSTATLVYDGTGWNFAGMDGGSNNYIQNQNAADQTANFRISATGRANTSFITPLVDSITGGLSIGTTTATGITIGGAATTGTIAIGTAAASTLNLGTGAFAHTIAIGTDTTTVQGITIGSNNTTSGTTLVAGSGNINLNASTVASNATTLALFNGSTTINDMQSATTINEGAANVVISYGNGTGGATLQVASATAANAAGSNITVAAGAANGSTTGNTGGTLFLNGGNAAGTGNNAGGAVTISGGTATGTGAGGLATLQGGAASSTAGSVGGAVSVTSGTGAASSSATAAGGSGAVTVKTGNGGANSSTGSGGTAADVTIQAGNGGTSTSGANGSGGNVYLVAGNAGGTASGTPGVVSIDSPVFTSTTESTSAGSYAVPQADIDGFGTEVITDTAVGGTVTVAAPRNTATGRVFYIVASNGSNSFTLSPAGGPSVNMNPDDTEMLVWNGAQWTASVSGSSLQQVYNNTSASPASIVTTSASKTLLVQAGAGFDANNLLNVANSFSSSGLSINTSPSLTANPAGTATTYTNLIMNSSIEANPLPSSGAGNWTKVGAAGASVARSTTYAYEGSASLQLNTTNASGDGVQQAITSSTGTATALTASTTYYVSWYANGAGTAVSNTIAEYAYNGSTFSACTNLNVTNGAIPASYGWTHYTCQFTTGSGATAPTTSNSLEIIQNAAPGGTRTWYVDAVQLELTGLSPYIETSMQVASVITTPVDVWSANNSTNAFQVQTAAGSSIINADTLNNAVGINMGSQATVAGGGDLQFGGSANRTIQVESATAQNTTGANLTIAAGSAQNASTGAAGGAVAINGGNAGGSNTFNGGGVTLTGGTASNTGTGGAVILQGGSAAAVAGSVGGAVTLTAGNGSTTGAGAAGAGITLNGGDAKGTGNNAGGTILLQAGTSTGTGAAGQTVVEAGQNATNTFQVQNASAAAVLSVDTTTGNGCAEVGLQATATSGSYSTCVGQSNGNGTLIVNSGTPYYSGLAFAQLNSTDVNTTNTTNYGQLLGIDANGNVGISNAAVSLTSPALAYWDGKNDPTGVPVAGQNGYAYPTPTVSGAATFVSSALGERLTSTVNTQSGSINWSFAQVPFEEVQYQFQSGGGTGADATWFYSYANAVPTTEYGTGLSNGYIIYFDEYWDCIGIAYGSFTDGNQCKSGGGANPLTSFAFSNGNGGTTHYAADAVDDGNWHNVDIQFFYNQIVVRWDGQIVINYTDSYGRNLSYQDFGFGARTGGSNNNHYIKGLLVTKLGTNTSQYDVNNVNAPLASNMYWDNSFNSGLTVMNQGALGVGTADPTATLEVDGSNAFATLVTTAGTVCQASTYSCSSTTAGNDVLGNGTSFTANMVGDKITFQDGYSTTITGWTNSTEITVAASELEDSNNTSPGVAYSIYQPLMTSATSGSGSTYVNMLQVGTTSTTSTGQTLLQLNSDSDFTDDGTCSTSTDQGAMYYNTAAASGTQGGSNVVRACVNGSWEDLVSTSGLGLMLYGIVPDSGPTAGDQLGITGNTNSACKVTWASTTSVNVANCIAYSGGRKIIVSGLSAITAISTASRWYHICFTGTNSAPAKSTASTTETGNLPSFTAGSPTLCIADVLTGAGGTITNIYDTRVFTTSTKEFATINSASTPGMVVRYNSAGTAGTVETTGTANSTVIAGVVVGGGGAASSTTVNGIIAISGTTYVKSAAGTTFASVAATSATAGYVGNGTPVANGSLGPILKAPDTTCTAATNCQYSVPVQLNLH